MKKRYIVLVLLVAFTITFMALLRGSSNAPVVPVAEPTATEALTPEAAPASKDDLIVVEYPRPQSSVVSPLVIKGKARGPWYFEGSFPVTLVDGAGTVLASHYATAQGEWMTTEYVPFASTIKYTLPAGTTQVQGYLILKKDNPSDDPKLDNSLTIPVTLSS